MGQDGSTVMKSKNAQRFLPENVGHFFVLSALRMNKDLDNPLAG